MTAEQDTPTQMITPGQLIELTAPAALTEHQERRALAVERSAWALTGTAPGRTPDPAAVLAVADYVITGNNPVA